MGDWVDIDIRETDWEETKLLSKNSRRTSHHRSVSYGSFLPTFTVDVNKLTKLLPEEEESEDGAELASGQGNRRHCRIDSLLDTSSLLRSDSETFLTVLETQLESLFTFIALHLSQVSEEMETFEMKSKANDVIHTVPCQKNPKSIQEDELDNVSIGGDSGIEDDHLGTERGFLSRIRDVLRNMKQSLDSSMQQLDSLVGIHDQRTQADAAQLLLNGYQSRSVELHGQIDGYISTIDRKLDQYGEMDERSKKILEVSIIQKAKKETMGCLNILGFVLLIVSAGAITYFSTSLPSSRWTILLRLLRSPLMVVAYIYLLGFNMMAWARSGINYVSIFNFPRTSSPTPRFMFHIATILSVLFTSMLVICLVSGAEILYISDKLTGFTMWIAIGIFWLNPFNVLNRLGRFSFLAVFVRILAAPFPEVMFADFWFADQLNSLLAFILDIQYLFCYSFSPSSWEKDNLALKSCTMVTNGIRPILSCLPALWRLLQCLRSYQRTRKVAHLFNAAKYFTTFPVVVFATFFAVKVKPFSSLSKIDLTETGWIIIAWLISSLVHALFCFYWDVVMDWGLWRVKKGYLLRPTLLYSRWTYMIAMVIDFFIRFACAAKLTLAIVYHIDSDVIYTLLILSEVLRRVLWNFFRVEYEQVLRS